MKKLLLLFTIIVAFSCTTEQIECDCYEKIYKTFVIDGKERTLLVTSIKFDCTRDKKAELKDGEFSLIECN